MQQTSAAIRTARRRDREAERGLAQLNIVAPVDSHPTFRQIAAQLRAGTPLSDVLATVSSHALAETRHALAEANARAEAAEQVRASAEALYDHAQVELTRAEERLLAAATEVRRLRTALTDAEQWAEHGRYYAELTGWRGWLARWL